MELLEDSPDFFVTEEDPVRPEIRLDEDEPDRVENDRELLLPDRENRELELKPRDPELKLRPPFPPNFDWALDCDAPPISTMVARKVIEVSDFFMTISCF